MVNKQKVIKRKLNITPTSCEEKITPETVFDENEEELLFNTINQDSDNDSSDSERNFEESDNEIEEIPEIPSGDEGDGLTSDDDGADSDDGEEEEEEESSGDEGSEEEEEEEEEESSDDEGEDEIEEEQSSGGGEEEEEDYSDSEREEGEGDSNTHKETKNLNLNQRRNEYEEHDTSDEEDIRNTVGNIPMNWYNEYKHLGYDWDGNQIIKPESGDQIDDFLQKMEDPNFWRTVKDPQTGQNIILTHEDIELIKRIKSGKIPDVSFDNHEPWIEWFSSEIMQTPLRKFPEHKRSFLPFSKSEANKISKLVNALKMGWIKTRAEQERLRAKKQPQYYMLWSMDDKSDEMRRIHKHIPAPKRHLPGHAESYNPPSEYLFDEKELKDWNKFKSAPWKRKLHFVPQKYESLRKVPAYERFIKERFLRCLDLYLCPRGIKMKLNIEPEDLVPKLPSPKDLQPFPTTLALEFKGHEDMIRTISIEKSGQYLMSGSDDGTVKIWEINTARCLKTFKISDGGIVYSVEWCPNQALSLILIACDKQVVLINPHIGDIMINKKTDDVLKDVPKSDVIIPERIRTTVEWIEPREELYFKENQRIILKHFKEVKQCVWHGRGDYFATVMPDGLNRSVLINQLSKRRSQIPFSKSKGLIQCVLFHPTKPCLFVATQRHVRIYDLVKQTLMKKLLTNSKWISTMSIHSGGDNLLVGTYDRKILWFDLDLSTKPYQTLRLHGTAVRGLAFHKRYPLFASGSDDRSLIVSHGMVYNDLLRNALIVPLKRLEDHKPFNDFGIFAVEFHPYQPWVFSAGADGTVKMYSN